MYPYSASGSRGSSRSLTRRVVGRFLSCSYRYLTVISVYEMAGVMCTYENWRRQILFQGVSAFFKRKNNIPTPHR
jgi:hypothetical protein